MILVGEKLNSSIKSVYEAIKNKDSEFIKNLSVQQEQAGVDYLDINAGAFLDEEYEKLLWLYKEVQKNSKLPPVIDTPNAKIAITLSEIYEGKSPLINSITLEKERFELMTEAAKNCNAGLVALCMPTENSSASVPEIAEKLANKIVQNGIGYDKIYIDPIIKPISSGDNFGLEALNNIAKIRELLPCVHIICGLSNVSYGLPKRALINRNFLALAIFAGLDSAIINPLDKELMQTIIAQNTILGKDEYCMDYIQAFRDGKI